jgi:hypothetical protein
METSESRMLGALILLLGVSSFAVGVYTNQLNELLQLLRIAVHLWGP